VNVVSAVYFAPGDTWQTEDASITWVDITDRVLHKAGVAISRGRSAETEQVRAGRVSLKLRNTDRLFDPTYSAGTYYGDLKPGVPLKIEGTVNGSDVQVFRGFIDGWPQEYSEGGLWSEVGITATDGLGKLALAKLPSSVYAYEVAQDAPDVWYRLNEKSGSVMGDAAGDLDGAFESPVTATSEHPNPYETVGAIEFNADQGGTYTPTYPAAFPLTLEACFVQPAASSHVVAFGDGSTSWATIRPTSSGLNLFAVVTIAGTEYFMNNSDVNPGDVLHVLASFENSTTGALYYNGVEVASTVNSGASALVLSGLLVGHAFGASGFDGEPIADVAIYSTDLDATRAEAHGLAFVAPWDGDTAGERLARLLDVAAWPADLRDLATGFSTLSPAVLGGVALDQMRKCEAAEQGRMFVSRDGKLTFQDRYWSQLEAAGSTSQVTFSDAGSDVPYTGLAFDYDDRLVFGRIAASTSSGYELTIEDATSLATYGDKTDSTLNGLDVTPNVLRALAEHRLLTYKEPSLRPRPITVALHDATKVSDAEAEAILELDLGHRVTITRTPLVGSAITQEALVESITHSIKADEWNVTLSLSPAGITSYGLWGDDWGTLTWGP
jgi:hypothetical protein